MIKGCQRRIIMVKDTKSRCFDAAYFVLRSDIPKSASEADMMLEASRLIDECCVAKIFSDGSSTSTKKTRKPTKTAVLTAVCCVLGLGVVVLLSALIISGIF